MVKVVTIFKLNCVCNKTLIEVQANSVWRNWEANTKNHMKIQKTQDSQTHLEKK